MDGRRMPYLKGPKVDPADVLPDGQQFREHRRVQATAPEGQGPARPRPDRKLVTYATGAAPGAADKPEIEAIVAKVREKNYGFRTLVHEIVQSKLFRTR